MSPYWLKLLLNYQFPAKNAARLAHFRLSVKHRKSQKVQPFVSFGECSGPANTITGQRIPKGAPLSGQKHAKVAHSRGDSAFRMQPKLILHPGRHAASPKPKSALTNCFRVSNRGHFTKVSGGFDSQARLIQQHSTPFAPPQRPSNTAQKLNRANRKAFAKQFGRRKKTFNAALKLNRANQCSTRWRQITTQTESASQAGRSLTRAASSRLTSRKKCKPAHLSETSVGNVAIEANVRLA